MTPRCTLWCTHRCSDVVLKRETINCQIPGHRQHTHETQWVNDQNEAIQTSDLGITSSYLGNLRKRFHVPFSKRNNIFGIELHLIQAFQQSPPSCATRRRKSNAPQHADFLLQVSNLNYKKSPRISSYRALKTYHVFGFFDLEIPLITGDPFKM